METSKQHSNWAGAMIDGFIPAWMFGILPDYRLIDMFCEKKETFPVLDYDNNKYVNVDFYNPCYVASVFGLSDDRSFFKPDAKAYLDDIETLLNKSIN